MALLYKAVLTPSKLELLQGWVPAQPWFSGTAAPVAQVGSYRFDDPDGEVGIETMLLQAGSGATVPDAAGQGTEGTDAAGPDAAGPVFQVPVTYRAAPLGGADEWLIGTVEHSVLGTRWVYDACGDPVYAAVLGTVILNGGTHVEQHWVIDGETVPKPLDTLVEGTGGGALLGTGAPSDGPAAAGSAAGPAAGPAAAPAAAGAGLKDAGAAHGPAAITGVETGVEATVIHAGNLVLEVLRRVTGEGALSAAEAASAARADTATAVSGTSALLLGRWPGEPEPRLLASASVRTGSSAAPGDQSS